MSFFDRLQEATRHERHELFNLPIIRDALEGKVSLESYRAFLAQAYYHVRHTVPLMMACGARLPSRLEWLREAVCEYIDEEYGHEQWVLDDIAACGGDKDAVRDGRPSLPIELMVSFLYNLIARDNPVGPADQFQVGQHRHFFPPGQDNERTPMRSAMGSYNRFD